MPLYEILCIASIRAPNAHLVKLLRKCHATIEEGGGKFRRIEHLGIRPLASRMRAHGLNNEYGRWMRLRIQVNPYTLAEVTHLLKVDEEMVRWLTLKKKHFAPKGLPEPMADRAVKHRIAKAIDRVPFDEKEGDLLRRRTTMDYWAARTLLKAGLMTPEEILSLGRWYAESPADPLPSNQSSSTNTPPPPSSTKPSSSLTSASSSQST
eukprot:gb/GEZN01019130.1/.p1 GENE.gb/GEZN01019130.1/~~gb/GEZN01019130.1/.p1  ORF type:complete len:208 (-),score=36.57 gb/GEZN01019130.1/:72-695(-)